MSETPGNMVRGYVATFREMSSKAPEDDWDKGWNAAFRYVRRELEDLASKIEGWEIRQETKA